MPVVGLKYLTSHFTRSKQGVPVLERRKGKRNDTFGSVGTQHFGWHFATVQTQENRAASWTSGQRILWRYSEEIWRHLAANSYLLSVQILGDSVAGLALPGYLLATAPHLRTFHAVRQFLQT